MKLLQRSRTIAGLDINAMIPVVLTASLAADGESLTITTNRITNGTTGFVLDTNSATPLSIGVVGGEGTTTRTATADRSVTEDEVLSLFYTPGDIVNVNDRPMEAFAGFAVTNLSEVGSGDETPPQLMSITILPSGNISFAYDESVTGNATGWTFSLSGGAMTPTYVSGSGTSTIVMSPSREITAGETGTASYDSGTGNTADLSSNALASLSGFAVTNNTPGDDPLIAAPATQLVANGGSLNFTPTLLAGTGITWTATSLPSGASVNSGTGALTGTLSSNGKYYIKLTASDGTNSDYVTVPVVVYGSTQTINSAWLADSGNQVTVGGRTCYVLKTSNRLYTLDTDVTADGTAFYIANTNITLNCNGHTITYNTDGFGASGAGQHTTAPHGIVLWVSWYNTEASISGGATATNFTIINGSIVADNDNDLAHGVYGYQADGHAFENMEITAGGKDGHCIYFQWAGSGRVHLLNSYLECTAASSFNRHQGPGNVGYKPVITAERSVLIGGNSSIVCNSGSVIHKNLLSHDGHVTNGYGVWLYQFGNCVISDNLILPTNGRGVLLNGYGSADGNIQTGNVISNNVILHLEEPNVEFGEALNPPAVRMRYVTGGNTFSGNTCLGIAGDAYTSASSLYLSDYGALHTANTFTDNSLTTIILQEPVTSTYCQPVTLEKQGTSTTPALDVISDNTCRSNCYLLRVSGYDGVCYQNVPISDNTWEYVTGDVAYDDFVAAIDSKYDELGLSDDRATQATAQIAAVTAIISVIDGEALKTARKFLYAMYYSDATLQTVANIIDSTYGSGVDSESYTYLSLYAGTVNVREGFTESIRIMDGASPVTNTDVDCESDEGDTYTVTTDGDGYATFTFYRYALTKGIGASDPFVLTNRDETTLTVDGYAIGAVVDHDSVPSSIDIGALNP